MNGTRCQVVRCSVPASLLPWVLPLSDGKVDVDCELRLCDGHGRALASTIGSAPALPATAEAES